MLVCMDDYNLLIFNMKAKILGTRSITTDANFKKGCRGMLVFGGFVLPILLTPISFHSLHHVCM